MRWSIEELFMAFGLYKSHGFWRWLIEIPSRIYRKTVVFFKWLFTGYTDVSIWDLRMFLIETVIFRLGKFIDNVDKSYPYEFENHKKWIETLKELRKSFIYMKNEKFITEFSDTINWSELLFFDKDKGTYLNPLSDDEKERMNEAYKKQTENDTKALKLLIKYFNDLWD